MSRTDGTFPSYVRVDLDPKYPKAGWDDGCRRCANCGRSWPNVGIFSPSPCHDVDAGIVKTGTPDMTWESAVRELLNTRFNKYYEKWNDGISDEELYWTNTDQTPVSEHEISEGMREIEKLIAKVEDMNAR